jgi:hypothetical protein
MTPNGPTPPAQSSLSDQTYDQAELALIADIKRLAHVHAIEGWGLLANGTRYLMCGCDHRARMDSIFWDHILDALRKERGPEDKKPK